MDGQEKIKDCFITALTLNLLTFPFRKKTSIKLLKKYPKLYIDVSWDIVLNIINTGVLKLKEYVNLINKYSTRFIIGSDFVGSKNKKYKDYKDDISSLKIIKKHLTDTAYINLFLGRNYINLYKLNYKVPI